MIGRPAASTSVRFEVREAALADGVRPSSSVTGEGIRRTPAALDGAGLVVVRPSGAPLASAEVTR